MYTPHFLLQPRAFRFVAEHMHQVEIAVYLEETGTGALLVVIETKKQSSNTGARANNTLHR